MQRAWHVIATLLFCSLCCWGQNPSATIGGRVVDPTRAVIRGVNVEVINVDTNIKRVSTTNSEGLFAITSLPPGNYRIELSKAGFRTIVKPGLVLHVQDNMAINFEMSVGSTSESITVEGGAPLVNTETGTVGTVIDRQFVANLPMNGRSFQTLIDLTPGVVATTATPSDPGQFSVNGQRATANYFSIDGVSANIGIATSATQPLSQSAAGVLPGLTAQGGTNSLVSVDALQEFRVQTSTFAPEFGRTPGAQIAILTRSGTNKFHGAVFEYLRNDVLDGNDWFANQLALPRSKERLNDFGGVLGGPIVGSRTFFFLSYEGLRLRLPQTGISTVPSLAARQAAPAAIAPFLNAYPLPNGPEILGGGGTPTGKAPFKLGYSDPSTVNATSIRIDHNLNNKLSLFGRYSYAPSESLTRAPGGRISLSSVLDSRLQTQTLTLGSTWTINSTMINDLRANYSRNSGKSSFLADSFGGAVVPSDSTIFPQPFSSRDAFFQFIVLGLQGGVWETGRTGANLQRQLNFLDNFSVQKIKHAFKFGVDYRHLSPVFGPPPYIQNALFLSVPSAVAQKPLITIVDAQRSGTILFNNLSAYAQDTWKATARFNLTYGFRWDVDFAPSTADGPGLLAVTGFEDPSTLALAPPGTSIYKTRYGNFAPRLGAAYELNNRKGRETVLRGGFGVFYDLASPQVSDAVAGGLFPFGASKFVSGSTFPLNPAAAQPPPITTASLTQGTLEAFDPKLKLPYTRQWNVALEQSLGAQQVLRASYIGAAGRNLIQYETGNNLSPIAFTTALLKNSATSDYDALQLQYDGRLYPGLRMLASYSWAHSIDTASASSATFANLLVDTAASNRGPSDFDVRHSFSAGLTYETPGAGIKNPLLRAVARDWSINNIIQVRSALPVEIFDSAIAFPTILADVRPDLVPGLPLYLSDPTVAGGRRINPAAFVDPPIDSTTGAALRQGTLGRNALRGFGAAQWDFAVRRRLRLREPLSAQLGVEFFNLLNHPNFANPGGDLNNPLFGTSVQMLGRGLGDPLNGGGLSPLFQTGGPRSIQVALRLEF